MATDSALRRERRLFHLVGEGEMGDTVLEELLPRGRPHKYESRLWDYKRKLPSSLSDRKRTDRDVKQHKLDMAEVVKDAVAFYNSFGGYLVAGVENDPTPSTPGYDDYFSCEDLNQKIEGATGRSIECKFSTLKIRIAGNEVPIGLLFIPRRPDNELPTQFKKNAPENEKGKRAYKVDDIYFRTRDQCRPARLETELHFLYDAAQRVLDRDVSTIPVRKVEENLPQRDPYLIEFVGREGYLTALWYWLLDDFSPVRLLTGVGGVGKTSIAFRFAEQLVAHPPPSVEKIIWLAAKKETYAAIQGQFVPTTRVDFSDSMSMLRAVLLEIGYNESDFDEDTTRQEFTKMLIEGFLEFPSLVVIDDVDSLEPNEQNNLFADVMTICNRARSGDKVTRFLLTSRLKLPAGESQIIQVEGMPLDEFCRFVNMTAKALAIDFELNVSTKLARRFRNAAQGSPIFATSILLLAKYGETIPKAIDQFSGKDGEEVRRFAFAREIEALSDSEVRMLFATSLLGQTTQLELSQVLNIMVSRVRNDLFGLEK